MKALLLSFVILAFNVQAQDPQSYFSLFDNKVYSLKTKGVKDFVLDVTSSRLTQQINDQKTFGTVKKVIFRVYWTGNPERLDIEVIGLPEGFREAKEELKAGILPILENVLPMTIPQRFGGYKFAAGPKAKEFIATDSTGLASVPSYVLRFDTQDRLVEIQANRSMGLSSMQMLYDKKAFSDGKWVLNSVINSTSENGQSMTSTRKLDYGSSQGVGVVTGVTIITEQKWLKGDNKPVSQTESLNFENYQMNSGAAFKHFLGDAP